MTPFAPDFLATALAPDRWPTFVLITARVGGLMLTAPGWNGTSLPRLVRTALTVVLAALLLPSAPVAKVPDQAIDIPLPIAAEMAIGLGIGLVAAVIVQAVSLAGEVMSTQMGLSIAPSYSPIPELQVSGIGPLTSMLALLLYFSIGGHLTLLRGLADSLQALPPGGGIVFGAGEKVSTELAGRLFSCAISAAAPVMVALLLTNVALGILSRAVPQLNAMSVSFPLSIGVGLLMFSVSLPIVASVITGWLQDMPDGVHGLITHLQH